MRLFLICAHLFNKCVQGNHYVLPYVRFISYMSINIRTISKICIPYMRVYSICALIYDPSALQYMRFTPFLCINWETQHSICFCNQYVHNFSLSVYTGNPEALQNMRFIFIRALCSIFGLVFNTYSFDNKFAYDGYYALQCVRIWVFILVLISKNKEIG